MQEQFKIYIDRLKNGATQKIDAQLEPSFMDIDEPELSFSVPIRVRGEAYLTDEHLVIHLQAAAIAERPCSICNKIIKTEISVNNFYHTELIQEIPSALFDYSEALREALLVELPLVVECNGGKCPERENIAPFIRSKDRSENPTYFPFNDMDI